MEKIKLEFPEEKFQYFSFGKITIEVNPCINLKNKSELIINYINSYINEKNNIDGYLEAEYGLVLGILEHNTNIDISDFNYDNLNSIFSSGLWNEVKNRLINYGELELDIDKILKNIKYKESYESNFNEMVKSLVKFFDKVSTIDLSPDGLKNLTKSLQEETGKLDDYIPIIKAKRGRKPKDNSK
jgi:hypothetical protein